ncbi:MAG: ribulose-phosphate 3-epimerase [Sutterella wadsworthensis]|nr:ribulose-phosphate 3-epimerase [Sutterella wadsworthensis]
MRQCRIAPSILSADFARLGQEVSDVIAGGADWIHFDVMDNHYVPNLTVGPLVLKAIRPYASVPVDVHLMVEPVDELVPAFAKAGADIITFHCEASRHVDRTLQLIRDHGLKAGLVFNPATPLTYLDYELDRLDVVLLMSVNPGFGGQSFIDSTLEKITQVRARLDRYEEETGRRIALEVDGGIKPTNIAKVAAAGADTFVAGSAVFGAGSAEGYAQVIAQMKTAVVQLD